MSAYSRWQDAMVAQTRLLSLILSPTGRFLMTEFQRSLDAQHEPEGRMPEGFLHQMQAQVLQRADPIYISADVTEVIDVARETFQPEPVRPTDPFVPFGFALFPRAILIPDSDAYDNGAVLPVRAVSWAPVMNADDPEFGCFWITFYTHADDDHTYGAMGQPVSKEDSEAMRRIAPLSVTHMFQWTFGDAPWQRPRTQLAPTGSDESIRERGMAQVTLAQVMWRIGQQFIRGKERAPRQIWKDAQRKGMAGTDVTVITLRRNRSPERDEPSGRVLTVRHIVRGHWHTYHTKEGTRQMWIAPFIRGADHLPFRATERVVEFTR